MDKPLTQQVHQVEPIQRRRGRPRVEAPLVPVMTCLPIPVADQIIATALEQRMSVSEVIRVALVSLVIIPNRQ